MDKDCRTMMLLNRALKEKVSLSLLTSEPSGHSPKLKRPMRVIEETQEAFKIVESLIEAVPWTTVAESIAGSGCRQNTERSKSSKTNSLRASSISVLASASIA